MQSIIPRKAAGKLQRKRLMKTSNLSKLKYETCCKAGAGGAREKKTRRLTNSPPLSSTETFLPKVRDQISECF